VVEFPSISVLEEAAFAAWPAREVSRDRAWRLRYTDGLTRRANSAWTSESDGADELETRIDRVEAFYRARALAPRFQVSDCSVPIGLERALERRGYSVEAPVSIRAAPVEPIWNGPRPLPKLTVELASAHGPEFLEVTASHGRFQKQRDTYTALLDRIGPRGVYAVAMRDGRPLAAAIGVRHGTLLGIFNMQTVPAYRRKGAGTLLVVALARHAKAHDMTTLYLQVERENSSALAFYARFGFTEVYGYHYRTLADR
jgi:ribosomal protein S18 acetylase RimI-like enzyme